jgi:hypothetical protein
MPHSVERLCCQVHLAFRDLAFRDLAFRDLAFSIA